MAGLRLAGGILGVVLIASATGLEPVQRDVSYVETKAAPSQSLDIYAPAKSDVLKPVMLFIHGGAWRIGDKSQVQEKPQVFVDRGYLFVSLNYRMTAETSPREQAADVARAIHWVQTHIAEYGGDPAQLFVMGHSAGAHLAALVSTDERFLKDVGLPLSTIQGTVLLDGAAYDVPRQIQITPLPRMREIYKSVFTEDPEKQRDASPITHVARDKNIPPFLILYVATRRDGKLQSEALADALRECGVSVEVIGAEGKTHMTINREIGTPDDAVTESIFAFLKSRSSARESP
ncbi:alpha/beta hydrolase fold domain-containing protein [bacterium]|nr:alpha/beta hydrolase fold domain-containing protein [bacterium]